ncbi:MAG: YfhO family protein, partial [Anaerolineales bacterium]|nr:YfhO family protein [Anaerolineales bacterium]
CLFSGEQPKFETIIDSPNHIEVVIDAKHNGWLFISDAWYPGWRVYIDNKRSELYRANYLFRGVKIETGKHTLKMVYRPLSFYIGATISGVMWLILLCFGLTKWIGREKNGYLN